MTRWPRCIAPWLAARSLAEVGDVFDRNGVCWGAYQTFAQLLGEDWRVSDANPVFRDIEQPGVGKVRVGGSPLAFGAIARDGPRPAPRLGEHTEQILADDLGLSAGEIAALARPRRRGRAGVSLRAARLRPRVVARARRGRPRPSPRRAHRRHARRTPVVPRAGDVLPALWHWAFFTPTTATAGLGTDGHPVLDVPGAGRASPADVGRRARRVGRRPPRGRARPSGSPRCDRRASRPAAAASC